MSPTEQRYLQELLRQVEELAAAKAAQHGTETDPMRNLRAPEDWGVEPWVACMSRVSQQMTRLQNLAVSDHPARAQAVESSFLKVALGALNGLALYSEQHMETELAHPPADTMRKISERWVASVDKAFSSKPKPRPEPEPKPEPEWEPEFEEKSEPGAKPDPAAAHEAHDEYKRLGRDPEQDDTQPGLPAFEQDDRALPEPKPNHLADAEADLNKETAKLRETAGLPVKEDERP
jgi:hypothetical protein